MNIVIRRFKEKDIPNKIKWINDNRNNKYLHYDLPLKYYKTLEWFNKNKDRTDRYDAVIEVDGISVGVIGLLSIDFKNKKAEYYITIGEQNCKGKGIATTSSKLLLDYAFEILQLNKVYLYTEYENIKAQKLFERIGFEKEGLLKEDIYIDGPIDRYAYGIYKNNYYNKPRKISIKDNVTIITKIKDKDSRNNIYIKRDDLIPVSFGGNKARKAKLFFEDIENKNCNCVVTYGSSSSNHCRIIANMAASKNLPCYIISPLEDNNITNNSKMIELFGAKIINCEIKEVKNTINKTTEKLRQKGLKPYFIEGGGHGNIGTQAYVDTFNEIIEYENVNGIKFDYIFHASGTGTTQAGLICGNIIKNEDKKIIGISIARQNPKGEKVVVDSVNSYLSSINKEIIDVNEIQFIDDYILDGYGKYNSEILETIEDMLINNTIPLDTTYTGKAYWGMNEYIKKNNIRDKSIVFIHTGGTPLFFDDLEEMMNGK